MIGWIWSLCLSQLTKKPGQIGKSTFPTDLESRSLKCRESKPFRHRFCPASDKRGLWWFWLCIWLVRKHWRIVHSPGPGVWKIFGSLWRPWSENAGVPSWPTRVRLEAMWYIGPGEQSEVVLLGRIPKLKVGAWYLVGSWLDVPWKRRTRPLKQ